MNVAKSIKVDEFYTLMADVEAELNHYTPFLKGKTISFKLLRETFFHRRQRKIREGIN